MLTIAAFSLLQSQVILHKKRYSVETRQSLLEVDIMECGLVFMEQPLPAFYNVIPAQEMSECLNISLDVIKTNLLIQIVFTGVGDRGYQH
jgi:predicted PhzF superfamily epimerase YddE/YHI9